MFASRLRSRYVGVPLLALLVLSLAPVSIGYAEKSDGKRAEKFIELAEKAREKVDELVDFMGENDIDVPPEIDELLSGADILLNSAKASMDVVSAKEAMVTFRQVFQQLHTLLEEGGVDTESGEEARGLLVAIGRARQRIDRINNTRELIIERFEQMEEAIPQTYVDWVKGNLTEADADLSEAADALPNAEWAAGNLTEANKNISEAFAALRLTAGWTNCWRIENFLLGIKRARERLQERLEQVRTQGINVTGLLDSLGYANIDEFNESIEDLIGSARENMGEIRNAIKDLRAIGEKLREIRWGLAKQRKG